MSKLAFLNSYEKLIFSVVNKIYKKYSGKVEFDELISKAYLILFESELKFDKSRGIAFSTYFYKVLYVNLNNHCKRELFTKPNAEQRILIEATRVVTEPTYDMSFIKETPKISADAQYIIDCLIDNRIDLGKKDIRTKKYPKTRITDYLKSLNWSKWRISHAMRQLEANYQYM